MGMGQQRAETVIGRAGGIVEAMAGVGIGAKLGLIVPFEGRDNRLAGGRRHVTVLTGEVEEGRAAKRVGFGQMAFNSYAVVADHGVYWMARCGQIGQLAA